MDRALGITSRMRELVEASANSATGSIFPINEMGGYYGTFANLEKDSGYRYLFMVPVDGRAVYIHLKLLIESAPKPE